MKLSQVCFKLERGLEVYGFKTQTACSFDVGERIVDENAFVRGSVDTLQCQVINCGIRFD